MAAVPFDLSYPYDSESAAEDAWRDMFRVGCPGNGVMLGALNELAVAPGSGRQLLVDTGRMWAAGQFGKITAQKAVSVTTNTSGQPRIDRLVARNNFTANQVELDILTGTPSGSPTAPALTSDTTKQEFSLAQIACANGYSNFVGGNITDERFFRSGDGTAAASAAARDLWLPSPAGGERVHLRDTGGLYLYDNQDAAWSQQRRKRFSIAIATAGNDDTVTASVWPTGMHVDIAVPKWATRAYATAKIGQVRAQTGPVIIEVDLQLGSIIFDSPVIRWDNTIVTNANERDIVFEGDMDVSSVAGTTVTFRTIAFIPGGSGVLRADVETTSRACIEFR